MEGQGQIRRAELSDARGIAEVQVAGWQSAYRGLVPDSTLERLSVQAAQEHWEARLAEPQAEFLVATQDERVVGFVGYGPSRDEGVNTDTTGEVHVLYIAPEEWHKGYGTALLREALHRLREKGSTEVVLWVLHNNEQAIAFYKATGFVADGTRRVKKRADGTVMTIARYRCLL